ncbi:DNA-processing protein DprA [Ureibacillus thermophilus]|uniref:DNA-protecting protein DprA n=1 Tax=Ureibacillus thermophilus TaxID=367743 RepID=A0A4P6UQS2_9BACL|nr:DNA-processing protein DprA [Ureibacillus thermophilus]QBK25619.1 DNA-protecting protein DprA [Ureibacillus thermophilus]
MDSFSLNELLALHYVYPLPLNKLKKLLNEISSLQALIELSPAKLQTILHLSSENANQILINYKRILKNNLYDAYNDKGIHVIPYTDSNYPRSLFTLIDPPAVLYAKGDLSLLKKRKIAIIGSRMATDYTIKALEAIIPPLIERDFIIVSGLAKGADTMAHLAAIRFGGKTIGILGNGLFYVYPKQNENLAKEMGKNHLLVTEFPPYAGPKKWHFPLRNRIISGISEAIVVTEAARKSGTLITTDHALEHGKDVFVVPGPIDSKLSEGTNYLLREGATPVWNGQQILEELNLFF